ncbi:hypothetical protein KDJ21_016445 [Metabacillus litoralis]|uniref:hypothetical protein n=1 Tax=Metabacillus litoralis TaxID=152268 RepID=UPI001B9116DC|nr:hypothetical protein [Metabacillus litoralis]UHA58440.1 hypothetical protein KDJ21_016445 [Metabacillus litoralis]
MSKRKEQVIKVDTLVIHAREVKVVEDRDRHDDHREDDRYERRRDPWGMFWGRRPVVDVEEDRDDYQEDDK